MSGLHEEVRRLMKAGPLAVIPDPYPFYARLRRECPVLELDWHDRRLFVVSRFTDAREVLRRDAVFSNRVNGRMASLVIGRTVIEMDGAEHLRYRALAAPSLAPRALRGAFPAEVSRAAHEVIDGFAASGRADLAADFTFIYPLRVFVGILGLPAGEAEDFHRTAADLLFVMHDPPRGFQGSKRLRERLLPFIAERRRSPGPDLLSHLVEAEVDGERLSDDDVVSFARLLVLAGAETTYHLLGSAIHVLLHDPELLARVRADRSLVEPILWETLRFEPPISTVLREALVDTEVAGVGVPAGSDVLVHIGSAHRDESRFPEPDRFDVERRDRDHLAFGIGRHYCLGSRLAMLEARLGLEAVLERLADLSLAPGEDSRIIGFSFRGPDRLPVVFSPLH